MLHVALFEPEIPPNTGNIIRLCANAGAQLHLIEPLGFELDDKRLRRAGLDYHEFSNVKIHPNITDFMIWLDTRRLFACTTKSTQHHNKASYRDEDLVVYQQKYLTIFLCLIKLEFQCKLIAAASTFLTLQRSYYMKPGAN